MLGNFVDVETDHFNILNRKVRNARDGEWYQPIMMLHQWERTVEIHNRFNQFSTTADGLLRSAEEEDVTPMYRIGIVQTLDIDLNFVQALCWAVLTTSCHSTLYWTVEEVDVVKLCICPVEMWPGGKASFCFYVLFVQFSIHLIRSLLCLAQSNCPGGVARMAAEWQALPKRTLVYLCCWLEELTPLKLTCFCFAFCQFPPHVPAETTDQAISSFLWSEETQCKFNRGWFLPNTHPQNVVLVLSDQSTVVQFWGKCMCFIFLNSSTYLLFSSRHLRLTNGNFHS